MPPPSTALAARRLAAAAGALLGIGLAAAPPAAPLPPLALEDFSTARSAHFVVHGDAAPERLREILLGLELFRATLAELGPELELRSPVPTSILAFRDAASYEPFKSGKRARGARILGQFLSHPDGNFITLDADPRAVGSLAVVYHEFVHYFLAHNLPPLPLWLNEGLAEYYSTFAVEGSYAVVGRPVERHLRWFRESGDFDLPGLLARATAPARAHAELDTGHLYGASWTLTHYLMSELDASGRRLALLLERLAAGEEPRAAFEESFAIGLEELDRRLERYLAQGRLPVASLPVDGAAVGEVAVEPAEPAEILALLGELSARQGRDAYAEALFALALAYEPDRVDALAGLAHLRDRQERHAEAADLFARALAAGPATAGLHLRHGRHLMARLAAAQRQGEPARVATLAAAARGAFADAMSLAPDFAEARVLLGQAHLFGDADPAAGIAELEAARELLPGRADVVQHLVRLELRRGDFDRAALLAERVLPGLDGESARASTAEVERARLVATGNELLRQGQFEAGLSVLDEALALTADPWQRERMARDLEQLRRDAAHQGAAPLR